MYDKLVKNLRIYANDETDDIRFEAADAIVELQDELQALKDDTDMAFVKEGNTTYLRFVKKWIPVTERLPEKDQTVLAYCAEDNFCYISRMHQSFEDYDVTHWIPLPQMPEREET